MNVISEKSRYLLILSMLRGVGPATVRNIARIENFHQYEWKELAYHLPNRVTANLDDSMIMKAADTADAQIETAFENNTKILSLVDHAYPRLLSAVKDDPAIIFVKGKLAASQNKSVAIIGTREPTKHGVIVTERITEFFVEQGWSIVSGLAIGCDSIAHKSALNNYGHTVAVLAHGLQTIAPLRHKKLAAEIIESGGALVTEYPFGEEARPQNFVKRDRIQAALASGVVMVQSDVKGGSLHASRASLDYNRWLASPYPTALDIQNAEAKIQANLLFGGCEDEKKAELLKCKPEELSRLITLRSKSDYVSLLNPIKIQPEINNVGDNEADLQGSLF